MMVVYSRPRIKMRGRGVDDRNRHSCRSRRSCRAGEVKPLLGSFSAAKASCGASILPNCRPLLALLALLRDLRFSRTSASRGPAFARVMSPSWHCGSRHCSGHTVVYHLEPVVGSSPACLRFDRDRLKRSDVAATRPLASIHGPSLRGLARTAWLEPEGYSAFDTISDNPVATSWLAF